MKRLRIASTVLVCLVMGFPVTAQESTEAALNRLEDARYEAMKNADVSVMGQLFADDLVYQTLQGMTYDKPGYVALFKSGDVKINSFRRENSRVKFYGDSATVMAHAYLDAVVKGEPRQLALFYLNVWAKRDGRWQLVARQSTLLPKK
jgi:ketosteroid isomerase-like protein